MLLSNLKSEYVTPVLVETLELEIAILESGRAHSETLARFEHHLEDSDLDEQEGKDTQHRNNDDNSLEGLHLPCQEINYLQDEQCDVQ